MTNKSPYRGARLCIGRGWRVAPLLKGLKKKPPAGYQTCQLPAIAQLDAWEAAMPGRNYAVVGTPYLMLLDIDVRDEKRGLESLAELERQYGALPKTFTAQTPTGGIHKYLRGSHIFKNGFRPGLDCPHYVVAPWSIVDGKRYEVIDASPLAPAPKWLPEVLGMTDDDPDDVDQTPAIELDQLANIARAIFHLTHDARRSIEGQNGEFALLMTAADLKDMGISKYRAIELLNEHYNRAPFCDPTWLVGDGAVVDRLDIKVANAWRYLHKVQPGATTAEADFAGVQIDDMTATLRWWNEFDAQPAQVRKRATDDAYTFRRRLLPATWRRK